MPKISVSFNDDEVKKIKAYLKKENEDLEDLRKAIHDNVMEMISDTDDEEEEEEEEEEV